jgi:uncharacterized protein YjbI with pentapeptide repeats
MPDAYFSGRSTSSVQLFLNNYKLSDMDNQNNKPPTTGNNITNPLLNILGNAMASSMKYKEEKPANETRKCANCGAARPEGTDLSTCDYCGFEFFKYK